LSSEMQEIMIPEDIFGSKVRALKGKTVHKKLIMLTHHLL